MQIHEIRPRSAHEPARQTLQVYKNINLCAVRHYYPLIASTRNEPDVPDKWGGGYLYADDGRISRTFRDAFLAPHEPGPDMASMCPKCIFLNASGPCCSVFAIRS